MATITDAFADDPYGTRWANLSGSSESYASGQWSLGVSYYYHTTQLDGVVQYAKVTLVNKGSSDAGEIVFRSTGVGSDGYYGVVFSWDSTDGYIVYSNDTGWVRDDTSFTGVTLYNGDTCAATITGTGTGTRIRLWKNPTNNTPAAVDGWDSAGDTADVTASAAGGWTTYCDTGRYVGLGNQKGTNIYDNFYAGDIGTVTDLSIHASECVGSEGMFG